jgi:hypothetical protein
MAVKIFAIKNKASGQVERLVKAESQSQVKKHLNASIEIEAMGAVEVVDIMASGSIRVEDATAQADDEGAAGAQTATAQMPPAGDAGQTGGDAGQPTGDGSAAE